MSYMQKIIPALIPKQAIDIAKWQTDFSFLQELHLDVVDGEFVPPVSWPYTSNESPHDVQAQIADNILEVDLMVSEQCKAAEAWHYAGAKKLVFHVEAIALDDFIECINKLSGVSIGVSSNLDTPYEKLETYLQYADYTQVMGIGSIGAQGAEFDERCLVRIKEIKQGFPLMSISVDGSMNENTIPKVGAAGGERFVVGSALLQAEDFKAQYKVLEQASTDLTEYSR